MKKFFASIPNRWKALYLVWVFIHFILFLTGSHFNYDETFSPLAYNYGFMIGFRVDLYNFSEFFIYVLSPMVIYYV